MDPVSQKHLHRLLDVVGPIKFAFRITKVRRLTEMPSAVTDQTFNPALAAFSNDFNTRAAWSSAVILFIKKYPIGDFQWLFVPTKRKLMPQEPMYLAWYLE